MAPPGNRSYAAIFQAYSYYYIPNHSGLCYITCDAAFPIFIYLYIFDYVHELFYFISKYSKLETHKNGFHELSTNLPLVRFNVSSSSMKLIFCFTFLNSSRFHLFSTPKNPYRFQHCFSHFSANKHNAFPFSPTFSIFSILCVVYTCIQFMFCTKYNFTFLYIIPNVLILSLCSLCTWEKRQKSCTR